MDWRPIRDEIRKVRLESGHSLRKLKEKAGIDPSTVHRIENTKRYPDYQPDLDTLDALVRAMGLTLSAFWLRIEGLRTQQGAGTNLPSPTNTSPGVEDGSSAPVRRDLDDTNAVIAANSSAVIALARAISELRAELRAARESAAASRADAAAPDGRTRGTG